MAIFPILFLIPLILLLVAIFCMAYIASNIICDRKGAPYVRSKDDKINTMMELGRVGAGDKVIDLGSGDGSLLIAAAERGAICRGIELNPFLVWHSRRRIRRAGLSDRIHIIQDNFFHVPLHDADVICMYLWPHTNEKLFAKLNHEVKPKTRIISHRFPIKRWTPYAEQNTIFAYQR